MFPVIPAAAAAYGLLKSVGKRPDFKIPDYFGANYEHMVRAISQAHEAQYGSGFNDIREALANSGILTPAATTDAFTRFGIAKGSDIAGAQAGAYQNELAAQRDAEMTKNKIDYQGALDARNEQMNIATSAANVLGSLYAKGKAAKSDTTNNTNSDVTPGGPLPDNQQWIQVPDGTGGIKFIPNPNYKSTAARVLRGLFGF